MDALDRMFNVLVRTLQARQPALLTAPFTVSDLHQQILPYRHFRRELGLETNQEYELTLMELLTGARGYLDVDERLRDQLGRELKSSSPEPSRVREYADAHVSVNQAALAGVLDGQGIQPGRPTTPPRAQARVIEAPASAPDTLRCRYCGGELPPPDGRPLHFCPHCGQNLQVKNCPACGAEVDPAWKFCVACGKAVS